MELTGSVIVAANSVADVQLETITHADSAAVPALQVSNRLSDSEVRIFHELLLSELPRYYDEVDPSFPDSIVASARLGKDPNGYFTASKSLYVGRMHREPVAFTVATHKRGGSVKMGPTMVLPQMRRSGVGSAFRLHVEENILSDKRVRKFYSTVSSANTKTLLLLMRLGYHIEGVLCEQYRAGSRELVMGKLMHTRRLATVPRRVLPQGDPDEIHVAEGPVDISELAEYLLPALSSGFQGLDLSYIEAIISALKPHRQDYQSKGKQLIVTRCRGHLSGSAVLVPKRGGALKLSPLVADDVASLEALIERCLIIARTLGRRRLYAVVSEIEVGVIEVLARYGFSIEAQLREAYRPGIDAVVMGKLP